MKKFNFRKEYKNNNLGLNNKEHSKNEISNKNSRKEKLKTRVSNIEIKPQFLVIGLVAIITVISLIYFIFLKYSPVMNFKYEGYGISGKQITENLLGASSSSENSQGSNLGEEKNVNLTKIEEQGTIFKKLNSYFIGNKEKTEVDLNYPIYINDKNTIYNLNQDITLISKNFEQIAGYPNISITDGKVYNGNSLERADSKEYIFAKTTEGIYINLKEIKIETTANEYVLPVNSLIVFEEDVIRYYSIQNNILMFNEIKDVDYNSQIIIKNVESNVVDTNAQNIQNEQNKENTNKVDKEYNYEELLTRLGIIENAKNDVEKEEIQKEDLTNDDGQKEEKPTTQKNETTTNVLQEQQPENNEQTNAEYIKPEVTVEDFKAEVYTAKSNLTIKDPKARIIEAPTFEIYKDGKIYLRRVFKNSGEIQITGLVPETEYEIIGKYIYLNAENKKVENTFYKGTIKTKGYEALGTIELSKEEGEIYSNKIQIKNVKIISDLQNEAIKGINQIELETGNIKTVLKNNKVNELLEGKEVTIESSEGLKSNTKIEYAIKFYDKNGKELKVKNNKGKTRTSKQEPKVTVKIKEQDIVSVTLGVKLTNKDNVKLENYKYIITRPNGEKLKEERLSEHEKEIKLEDLDQNQYYKIKVYADYDLSDNKGIQKDVEIGNLVFATKPISTLGSLEMIVENKELTSKNAKISYKIDEDKTDKRLIQILNELTIKIVENNDDNKEISKPSEEAQNSEKERQHTNRKTTKEDIVIYTNTLTKEEIEKLQLGETKEINYENLKSNTKYTIEITGNVELGNTKEEVPVTYTYKEFTTLKIPAKVEIKNQFVTGNLIDLDVRVEDEDKSVLNNKVRMELRDEKSNLIDLQEIETNKDWLRKTYEKLEENKTYKLSFYADQYNEGSTDATYKVNYLIKEIEIVTEPNILGNLKLVSMEKKANGKNLVDVISKNNWSSNLFNTDAYYRKEYVENKNVLKLYAGKSNKYQRYTYNLENYIGKTITISFKGKLEGDIKKIYILKSKATNTLDITNNLDYENWNELSYTIQVDDTGYLGFRIQAGEDDGYLLLKDLQIELGDKKTEYEHFKYKQKANINIQIENKQKELITNKYYIRICKNNSVINEKEFENFPNIESGIIFNNLNMDLEKNTTYKLELLIRVNGREYILDSEEINSNDEELKGIASTEEFYDIQPEGNYIITNEFKLKNNYCINTNIRFNGHINFDGHEFSINIPDTTYIFGRTGNECILENMVLNLTYTQSTAISYKYALTYLNYGTIRNIIINVDKTTPIDNNYYALLGEANYGKVEKFVVNLKQPLWATANLGILFLANYDNGTIKNGYIYGENLKEYATKRNNGEFGIVNYNRKNAIIKNVYNLTTIDYDSTTQKYSGNIISENDAIVQNVYSVNISESMILKKIGPNIAINRGIVKDSYYFSDKVFKNSTDKNTTKLALWDAYFQNKVLNSEEAFNVDKMVKQGYYPQLKMPDCMPVQEYIKLPEIEDKDLIDILSTEVLEQKSDSAKVRFNVNNPSAETVTEIKIENLQCEILSQEYNAGKSEIIANLYDPTIYVSNYDILSITSKGAFNNVYTRNYEERERTIEINLYRPINSIDDWKEINKYPNENYMLETDLDFRNDTSSEIIISNYRGNLDGNGHKIQNILIENSTSLIGNLYGEIHNLYIENYITESKIETENLGIIGAIQKGGIIDGLYVNFAHLTKSIGSVNVGIIAGKNLAGTIKNSYVKNSDITIDGKINIVYAGGILGLSNMSNINNSYVQNVKIKVNNALETAIGGIVGNEIEIGNINYCYSDGLIESSGQNIGGIIGKTTGNVKSNYSFMNIVGNASYIGGITGFDSTENNQYIEKNLALGNIYSVINTEHIGRIFGNKQENTNNYAYNEQLINGYIQEETTGAHILNYNDLMDKNTYINFLEMGDNFYYEQLSEGLLPKLRNSSGLLIPNQDDISFANKQKLKVLNIYSEKIGSNSLNVRIEIENKNNYEITGVEIDGMDVKIDQNVTQNKITIINFTAVPNKYYDSYKLSKIVYLDENVNINQDVEIKINEQFYKELYNFEDWQEIDNEIYQNYKLMADIDFYGKKNIKTNIKISRFDGNGYKLKNINLVLDKNMYGIINTVKTEIKDVIFEKINIENLSAKNNVGIIVNNTGVIENLKFKDVTINAPNADYVAIITKNENNKIANVTLENIYINGKRYTSSFIAYTYSTNIQTIIANNINITGKGYYIGGIFAYIDNKGNAEATDIRLLNSNIQAVNGVYVGGIVGYIPYSETNIMQISNIILENNHVYGNEKVGGVGATLTYARHVNAKNNTVSGNNYVGGIGAFVYKIYDIIFEKGNVQNNGNITGGITASSWNMANIYDVSVIDSNIISDGNDVGGIAGKNLRTIQKSYVEKTYIKGVDNVGALVGDNQGFMEKLYAMDCKVEGKDNVGGVVGILGEYENSYVRETYNNSEIKGNDNVGGIIGTISNDKMTDTYNRKEMKNNYTVNNITGNRNVGGFIGNLTSNLYKPVNYTFGNYVQTKITSNDENNTSIGIGNRAQQNIYLANCYFYKYSNINGTNPNEENEIFIEQDYYLKEEDLKNANTYTGKLRWETAMWNINTINNNKYPILANLTKQEGIDIPKDSENIIENTKIVNEKVQTAKVKEQTFKYLNKKIETYSTYSVIISDDESKVTRNAKLYVKDNNLYAIPVMLASTSANENIIPVANNLVLDSYNGKEYETVLGSDGKLYDLKEPIKYPEDFINADIKSIGNNLSSDLKEVEIIYENDDRVKFNYQTGEILQSSKMEKTKSLTNYIKEKTTEIAETFSNVKGNQNMKNKYLDSQVLERKLEETPLEEALQRKNNNLNKTDDTNSENDKTNNSLKEIRYIRIYNAEKDDYQIYQEEELLDTSKQEVISENDKIEANNLKEYYASEGESKNTKMGIVWITLSIVGVIIILFAIKKRD